MHELLLRVRQHGHLLLVRVHRHLDLSQLSLWIIGGVFLKDVLSVEAIDIRADKLKAVKLMLRFVTCPLEVGKAPLRE